MRVALIDYGAGNLRSVAKALEAAGPARVELTSDPDALARADRIVLPGVGAFGACRAALAGIDGMVDALDRRVRSEGAPFLGICVGMQLMAERGEEHGTHAGLGWIAGVVRRMAAAPGLRIPHMGWNAIAPTSAEGLVAAGHGYFVHGYALEDAAGDDVVALTDHGGPVIAAVRRETALGVQFHPEKSQRYGLDLLARWLAWRP